MFHGAGHVGEVLFGNSNQVPTATAVPAAPPDSAVPALSAGSPWGAAGLQPAPCVPWAPTADTGLTPAAEAGGMAAAAVPQAPTGQLAAWGEAEAALAWPSSTAADARTDCSSFGTVEQAPPSALGLSMQLLLFQQLLETLPENNLARQQGGKATYRAPPRLPGMGLLGCAAAGSGPFPAGEGSAFPALAVPPAAREGTAIAAATAEPAAATAAAAPLWVPQLQGEQACQAFKGGGGSSLLQPQHQASSTLWSVDSGAAQHSGRARMEGSKAEAGTGKRKTATRGGALAKATQALEAACLEVEREKAALEMARKEEQALEQLLDYQEELSGAMSQLAAQEGNAPLQIPTEALRLLEEWDVSGMFPCEKVLRYPVAGDTSHLGPDGRVYKVPTFAKVLEDWRQIVGGLKQLLSDGRTSGGRALEELGQQALHGPSRSFFLPEGLSWEAVTQLASSLLWQQQQKMLLQAPGGPVPAAPSHTPSAELQVALSAAVVAAAAVGHQFGGGGSQEGLQGHSVGLAGSAGPPSASEANSLRPASQAEEHVRRLLILGRLRGLQHGTTADDRLVVQHSEGPHVFSKGQLQEAAQLLFRTGLLLWQQALLCPNSFGRLACRRLDVGPEGDDAAGEQDPKHWEGVVASLELEPKQALEIVQLYREYVDKLALIKRDRAAAAKAVQQAQAELESLSLGLGPQAQASLDLQRAAATLDKCSLMEHLSYVELISNVYRVLNFPVQKAKLFTSSWPYFPQMW